jgi:uncharacterized protein
MKKIINQLFDVKTFTKDRMLMYFFGIFLFSVGAKFFIDSKLGVDPLDVLTIGMTKHLPITIGIASGIVAVIYLAIWSSWNKKIPPLMPFFTTFIVGNLIDLWNYFKIQDYTSQVFSSYPMLFIGLLCCSYASSYIIMSGIGIRIMDLVAITIVEKWNWSFFMGKMLFEVMMFSTGYFLGGPIGVGTLAFLCFVGTLIQPFMVINKRVLRIPNYGIAKYNKD